MRLLGSLIGSPLESLLGSLLLFALAATAAAQSYSVEGSGGPFDLSARLEEAAATWNRAAEEAELEESAGADTSFSFANPALLGPDVVSATLIRRGEEGFDVWLNPDVISDFPQALLHELGLVLGLPAEGTGVMDPALSADTPDTPTEADVEALARALARAGGDIDGDGDVDIFDLAALGRAYGQEGVNKAADLDGDGDVDADDVSLLRENYNFTEPEPVETPEVAEEPQQESTLDLGEFDEAAGEEAGAGDNAASGGDGAAGDDASTEEDDAAGETPAEDTREPVDPDEL